MKLQLLAVALIAALAFLHYLLWIDENGVRQTHTLRISIQAQTEKNAELAEQNRALAAEVEDLKRGLMAIEERARSDMGMIRPDETFYRLLEKPLSQLATPNKSTPLAKPASPATSPAPSVKHLAPTAKPLAPVVKPVPVVKPASVTQPAPAAKPPAPVAKPAPAAKPVTPAPKPTPRPGAPQRRE